MRTIELLGERQQREGETPCALFVLVRGSEVYRVESGHSRFDEVHIDPARVRGSSFGDEVGLRYQAVFKVKGDPQDSLPDLLAWARDHYSQARM
ncbi:hypothetical protein HYT52_02390 [Candidatus Woesearchaeota archaeon]|nr:hypothetical protein [Candidatus Woesearchaeota archaeon]